MQPNERLSRSAIVAKSKAKYRSLGLCRNCPTKAEENRSLCVYHRELRKGSDHKVYLRRRDSKMASGLCYFCDEPGSAGPKAKSLLCKRHRDALNKWSLGFYHRTKQPARRPGNTSYPYLEKRDAPGLELLLCIDEAVPKTLPESIRSEVCQDIAVALLEGSLDKNELPRAVKRFVSAVFKQFSRRFGPCSLDQPFAAGSKPLKELL